ncbi:MAG: hypothetical protein LBF97_05625 [Elusimicrobiota bacterium]|nr:hypothetical protein [Elusimicrobiota bacterium]
MQKTKAGLILPAGMQKQSAQSHNINGEKKSVALILHDIGSAVPTDKFIAKVGDECVVNLYDAQYIGDDTITYCLTRWSSVGAVVKARRTE